MSASSIGDHRAGTRPKISHICIIVQLDLDFWQLLWGLEKQTCMLAREDNLIVERIKICHSNNFEAIHDGKHDFFKLILLVAAQAKAYLQYISYAFLDPSCELLVIEEHSAFQSYRSTTVVK